MLHCRASYLLTRLLTLTASNINSPLPSAAQHHGAVSKAQTPPPYCPNCGTVLTLLRTLRPTRNGKLKFRRSGKGNTPAAYHLGELNRASTGATREKRSRSQLPPGLSHPRHPRSAAASYQSGLLPGKPFTLSTGVPLPLDRTPPNHRTISPSPSHLSWFATTERASAPKTLFARTSRCSNSKYAT